MHLKQLSPEGSTAQNGQKWLKIAKMYYFTIGAHTGKSRFLGPPKPLKSLKNTQNDIFISQTCINVPEMHPKTTFILKEVPPKMATNGSKSRKSTKKAKKGQKTKTFIS